MSCVNPIYISKYQINVPCGRCMQCRIAKQSSLQFLATKELLKVYKSGQGASFVTLTYDDDHIPYTDTGHNTLRRKDLQDFMKRLRRRMEYYHDDTKFKYIACGEYGDKFGRSHMHIVFLGLSDYQIKAYTKKVWPYGIVDVGPLTSGGVRYVLKYCTKSAPPESVKALYNTLGVEQPFIVHSVGIGKDWIKANIEKIAADGFQFKLAGKNYLYPKYIRDYVHAITGVDPKPYIVRYIKHGIPSDVHNIPDYMIEKNYIKEQYLIASARSNGQNVQPFFLAGRDYLRPKHTYKDTIQSMAYEALIF